MENNKFKSVLQEKVNKDRENAKKDEELRKEFGIEAGRTVGIKVHKDNILVSLWNISLDIIRFIMKVVIFGLAAVGAYAIINPSSREVLLIILRESIEQIRVFAPFLPI